MRDETFEFVVGGRHVPRRGPGPREAGIAAMSAAGPPQGARPPSGERREATQGGQHTSANVLSRPLGGTHVDAATGVAIRTLGMTDYVRCWRAMQSFTDARTPATRDEIWLTEHPPVYTLGLAARREHVHDTRDVPVVQVDRGGQVTYHGPGQLVAYLLFDLKRARLGVRTMVRAVEGAVVEFLDSLGVSAYGKPTAPGVYVMRHGLEAKIAALGLKVRNGCTYHGLALNVAMDLSPFAAIDPCGYPGLAVTSLADLHVVSRVEDAGAALAPRLAAHLKQIDLTR